jgi:Zinc carboxypeptidase
VMSQYGFFIAFPNNGIISRALQVWYEGDNYTLPVVDNRAMRIQPGYNYYTYNYEGLDPDGDGLYSPYSGEDFVGGTDANRNYGEPRWGDCAGDLGCSWLSGSPEYAGPNPFSEPETAAVAAFLRSHPNIVSLESLHSGENVIYPPDRLYPDDLALNTMDQRYQDAVAQYISQETGNAYGGQYSLSKGSTISYSYFGSSQDPAYGLDFFPGGVLSFVTEIYGMGTTTGSAEAVRDWFPNHYQHFDTNNPQGLFLATPDFPYCTTCNPNQMPGPLGISAYLQYFEYLIFNSTDQCGGATNPDIFHCDYWGMFGNTGYYADKDIFAHHNPPAANRCYSDWNCTGMELERTVDKQIKHLLYRLYIAPFINVNAEETTFDGNVLSVAIENTGLLRSSIQTTSRLGEDPFVNRYYDYGQVSVNLLEIKGHKIGSLQHVNIGWLGGGHPEDPEPRVKKAQYTVEKLKPGDTFLVTAGSEKTGNVTTLIKVMPGGPGKNDYKFDVLWTNYEDRSNQVDAYFAGVSTEAIMKSRFIFRTQSTINQDMARNAKDSKPVKGVGTPFDIIPGYIKGIKVNMDH